MTTTETTDKKPLWLLIEDQILSSGGGNSEQAIADMATALDGTGYNVSKNAGNMIHLRRALAARSKVGTERRRPVLASNGRATGPTGRAPGLPARGRR